MMGTLSRDLLYSLRSLRQAQAFTATVIVTLALGVGANSAIFSVVNAVLLRPVPFGDADRVVHLSWEGNGHLQSLSASKFQYWHDHARAFKAMATWSEVAESHVEGLPSPVRALAVSPDFFEVVGYAPVGGPGFAPAHFAPGAPSAAVISHALWEARYAGADVADRTIRLEDALVPIVGVLPESFDFPYTNWPIDVVLPLHMAVDHNDISEDWPTIARLGDGVTHDQARTDTSALFEPFRAEYPNQVSDGDRGMRLATFNELYVDRGVQRALWITMGAVVLILLIACVNVANLSLVRALERRKELAVRAALGASQARLGQLVLTESAIIASAAAVAGLALGTWISGALIALTPADIPRLTAARVDWRVLVFTAGLSLLTTLLAVGAAWLAAPRRLVTMLNGVSRGSSGPRRIRTGLLIGQSALAMLLLIGAGLLVVTLNKLTKFDRGFDVEGLVAARLTTSAANDTTAQDLWEFEQRVLRQLEALPSIASVVAANSLPLERGLNTPMTIPGKPDSFGTVEWRAVTPGYFDTLGITRMAGRAFDVTDAAGGPSVAIVNDTFARRHFSGTNPIGQRIEIGRAPGAVSAVEIVGVVADVRDVSVRTEPRRTIYVPQAQDSSDLSMVLRTMPVFIARPRSNRTDIARALQDAIHAADPSLPAAQVFPLDAALARSLVRERFGAMLLSTLAALALALTAVGIHGVLAYTVQQRRREIGIRMALGARAAQVSRLVMAQGVAPVVIGLAIGVASAFGLSRFVAAFLWGVTSTDPTMLWAVGALLLGVAVAASWVPARTAARLDPARVLTHDS